MIFSYKNILSRLFKINKASFSIERVDKKRLKTQNYKNLHDNLKQLEFISNLESHLDKKENNKYTKKLSKELDQARKETQLNTINSIRIFNKH